MNYDSLYNFLVLSQVLNFTKASERLSISQQALSKQIHMLEREYGVTFFHRKRKMALTYAGIRFAQYASEIVELEERLKAEMNALKPMEKGKIRISTNEMRASCLFPAILPKFYEEFPYMEVVVNEGNALNVENSMISNSVDFMLGVKPDKWLRDMQVKVICPERLLMLAPKAMIREVSEKNGEDVCRKLMKHMELSLLSKLPFIRLNQTMAIQKWADSFMQRQNFSAKTKLETYGVQTLHQAVCQGIGVAFCIETFLYGFRETLESGDCPYYVFPVEAESTEPYELCIFYGKNMRINEPMEKMIYLIDEFYHSCEIKYYAGKAVFINKYKEK